MRIIIPDEVGAKGGEVCDEAQDNNRERTEQSFLAGRQMTVIVSNGPRDFIGRAPRQTCNRRRNRIMSREDVESDDDGIDARLLAATVQPRVEYFARAAATSISTPRLWNF